MYKHCFDTTKVHNFETHTVIKLIQNVEQAIYLKFYIHTIIEVPKCEQLLVNFFSIIILNFEFFNLFNYTLLDSTVLNLVVVQCNQLKSQNSDNDRTATKI